MSTTHEQLTLFPLIYWITISSRGQHHVASAQGLGYDDVLRPVAQAHHGRRWCDETNRDYNHACFLEEQGFDRA